MDEKNINNKNINTDDTLEDKEITIHDIIRETAIFFDNLEHLKATLKRYKEQKGIK